MEGAGSGKVRTTKYEVRTTPFVSLPSFSVTLCLLFRLTLCRLPTAD